MEPHTKEEEEEEEEEGIDIYMDKPAIKPGLQNQRPVNPIQGRETRRRCKEKEMHQTHE